MENKVIYNGMEYEVIEEKRDEFLLKNSKDEVAYIHKSQCTVAKNQVIETNYYELWPGIEALDVMAMSLSREEFIGFLKGNILKYQLRKGNKPGEPLEKDQEKLNSYKQILKNLL